jgi:hypothetical protein
LGASADIAAGAVMDTANRAFLQLCDERQPV